MMDHPAAYAPGPPAPTPEQRLLLMDEDQWELFIERCARQLLQEGQYVHVQHLGGAGDKGRDVCGYLKHGPPQESEWDLYQGKYYEGSLSPSEFAPELAKFLVHVFDGTYTRPRHYFVCALKLGTSLFDRLRQPDKLREYILENWPDKPRALTADLRAFVEQFPFAIFRNKTPADLLDIHARNPAMHWKHFGILDARAPNPSVPDQPTADESRYVEALLRVYSEQTSVAVVSSAVVPQRFRKHFTNQRRLFYSAEGLNRFSRDKLPGAFDDLLSQVEIGVGTVLSTPQPDGLTRLSETLKQASMLNVTANPLSARLQAGDLPGACHHLANQDRADWMQQEE
jgi:hypothetical protein